MLPRFLFGIVCSSFGIGTIPDEVLHKASEHVQAKWRVDLRLLKEDFESFLWFVTFKLDHVSISNPDQDHLAKAKQKQVVTSKQDIHLKLERIDTKQDNRTDTKSCWHQLDWQQLH